MVYSNKFVMCLIVDGVVQKELTNNTVNIPFGTEYTLRFRNKNNRRSVVKFKIDGEDASGNGYVISPNGHVDIKRYAHKDCAFKFVSVDSEEAIDYGKNNSNKCGLIEASFCLEKDYKNYTPKTTEPNHFWKDSWSLFPQTLSLNIPLTSQVNQANQTYYYSSLGQSGMKNSYESLDINLNAPNGVTVEGKVTGQNFHETFIETESDSVLVWLLLQGVNSDTEANLEKENENLRKEIDKEIKKKQVNFLLEENKKLREELRILRG